jgi:hypothetical protein
MSGEVIRSVSIEFGCDRGSPLLSSTILHGLGTVKLFGPFITPHGSKGKVSSQIGSEIAHSCSISLPCNKTLQDMAEELLTKRQYQKEVLETVNITGTSSALGSDPAVDSALDEILLDKHEFELKADE